MKRKMVGYWPLVASSAVSPNWVQEKSVLSVLILLILVRLRFPMTFASLNVILLTVLVPAVLNAIPVLGEENCEKCENPSLLQTHRTAKLASDLGRFTRNLGHFCGPRLESP